MKNTLLTIGFAVAIFAAFKLIGVLGVILIALAIIYFTREKEQ